MVTLRQLRRGRNPRRSRPAPPPSSNGGASDAEDDVDGAPTDSASSCNDDKSRSPQRRRHRRHHEKGHHPHHYHHCNYHPYVNVVNTFPARPPCTYRYWSDMPCASSYEVHPAPTLQQYVPYLPPHGFCAVPYPSPYVATCPSASAVCTPCPPRC